MSFILYKPLAIWPPGHDESFLIKSESESVYIMTYGKTPICDLLMNTKISLYFIVRS